MDPSERLRLLFAGDEATLHINTGLRSEPPAEPPAEKMAATESLGSKLNQLMISVEQANKPPTAASSLPPSPHDGTFCPMTAISRYPYHYIRGDLMQKVASRFFDKAQFFDRPWDLYYIHAPDRLGGRPLVLVPCCQVRKLLRDVNTTFQCSLSLPPEEEKGLVLRFNRDGYPQPTFLGHSFDRETKDRLEALIPVKSSLTRSLGERTTAEDLIAYERMMEAAVASAKSKSKSKAKKQRLRVQRTIDTSETIQRAQCYLGLRADSTDLIDCSWKDLPSPGLRVTLDKPAPYPFWRDAVFVSIDIEVNERCHTQITEIGISTLDARDLAGVAPGLRGENWQSRIKSRHLRVQEHRFHVNQLYIRGCPENFEFGTSEWVAAADIDKTVQKSFVDPSFFDGNKLRPLVLVGHNLEADIKYFQLADVHVIDDARGASKFSDRIDTAAAFQMIRGATEPRSLGHVVGELGMTGWNLHNAGNDARYTIQALIAMLLEHTLPSVVQDVQESLDDQHESAQAVNERVQEADQSAQKAESLEMEAQDSQDAQETDGGVKLD
ncbi:hypothetical protein BJY04DRAFT_216982 [Aspergillus karnatakaensis]|uniref:uncharacterized protein n=1 Tax=Aspergillus karnatakaensis TaxID=1810916 RepID=UPI003CCD0D18